MKYRYEGESDDTITHGEIYDIILDYLPSLPDSEDDAFGYCVYTQLYNIDNQPFVIATEYHSTDDFDKEWCACDWY